MHTTGFFYQALIYLAAAVLAVPLARRLGLGSVLGYLMAGMVIGPFGLALIGGEGQDVMHFAEFGVVMMLFLIGLELQPGLLWRMRFPVVGLGGLQVLLTTLTIALLVLGAGQPWQTALAVGLILSLSSTAIVLQTLSEKGLMKTDAGQNSFSVLLFQDISVIPMLAVLPLLAVKHVSSGGPDKGGGHSPLGELPGWGQTVVLLAVVASIIVAGRYLVRPALRVIAGARLRELFTAAALLLVIGIAELMILVGLSPALGTFLAGVVLADSEYRHELEAEIEPFKGLLLGLFFIAVGASINFEIVASNPAMIAGLVAALMTIKLVILVLLGRIVSGMGFDQNLLFSMLLAQGGEFGFVLFSFASRSAVIPDAVVNPLVAVVALSMSVTPVMLLFYERLIRPRFGTLEAPPDEADSIHEKNPVIIAGFGRFGNIVGRFLRASGVRPTVLEYDSERVEVLRRLGLKVYFGDATRHDLLRAAGAEGARLLVVALDEHEKVLEIVETARKHFPHLTLLARANGRREAYELLELGVEHVYRETLDTSLHLGVDALRLLGFRSFQAHRASRKFRRHDEETVRELMGYRHDRKSYLSLAKQRIQDLEQTLLAELEDSGEQRDVGWETETLREEYGSAG